MIYYVNTQEDFIKIRDELKPVYINSEEYGAIEVPCINTILVKKELIIANNYNPNNIAPDKMKLLKQSILDNGWCYPIVAIWDDEIEQFVIIDGFHRDSMGDINWLNLDYIPLVVLKHEMTQRLTATMSFNRARGTHEICREADVIRALIESGMPEEDIAIHLGMEIEAIYRYKSLTGISELFRNVDYSLSWEMKEDV